MVQVIFYAKLECKGNARQARVLQASGHDVVVRDLLAEPWSADELRSFFGARPASDWFKIDAGEALHRFFSRPHARPGSSRSTPRPSRRAPTVAASSTRNSRWAASGP